MRGASAATACALILLIAGPAAGAGLVGRTAPDCKLRPLGAQPPVDLRALRGKVVYVDFWASWCRPCTQSFPFLNALDRDLRARGLEVLGINVDEREADARAFLARYPASFRLGADPSGECPRAFEVAAMPSSYLVDRKGVVRAVHLGFRPGQAPKLRQALEALLAEPADGD
jgi:peroxiredoxin